MKLVNFLPRFFLFLVLGLMMTGCAYVHEKLQLEYHPEIKEYPICMNRTTDVYVHTIDNRRCKEVGCKKGDSGIELGSLSLKNDLATLVTNAVSTELEKCNFNIAETGTIIEIEINRFQCDFKPRSLGWNCVSELILNVNVIKFDGTIIYSKTIIGTADNLYVWMSSGGNAKIALEAALSEAVCKLINDRFFLQAIQKASL